MGIKETRLVETTPLVGELDELGTFLVQKKRVRHGEFLSPIQLIL